MRVSRQALGLLGLAHGLHGESLPYNPTQIFLSPNSSLAYILQPSSEPNGQALLSAIDYNKAFEASAQLSTSVSKTLPFLEDGELIPYTATIDGDGNITAISGNCSKGASGTQVWRFVPDSDNSGWSGSWSQYQTSTEDIGTETDMAGPNFLASSVAFSEYIDSNAADTNIYTFGGMCPYGNSTVDTWISAAEYSNLALTLSPDTSAAGGTEYTINMVTNRGPPIAQAGSSITALPPTYSMNSTGVPQTQQQNFVLLGGHTQSAFINTSSVALFSLPQQSWAFVPVRQPSNGKIDLAARQTAQEVTPRSGHTAVLSETGDSIVFFGGWVGDVYTPAEPQLAVLELGSGYGGSADWKWIVPHPSGNGPASGSGIYGHGAAMLPGGVLMVLGGYEIPDSTSKRLKREVQSANNRVFLYNTTSNAWIESYTPPAGLTQRFQSQAGPLSTHSEKVGMGTGLGIGAAILVSVVAFYFWYSKRLKHAREERARALLSYSSDGSSVGQIDQPFFNKGDLDGRGADEAALGRFWPTGGAAGNGYPRPTTMQHTTGMFVNAPSPTRGLRKGTAVKNYQYHAAPRYDDKRLSRGTGLIHPIAEHENEDDQEATAGSAEHDRLSDAEQKLREVERVLNSDDPFKEIDPGPKPLGSHPVSPVAVDTVRRVPTGASRMSVPLRRTLSGELGTSNWIVEPEALAEDQHGRVSPSKSEDRTSSTLSERSQHSTTSTNFHLPNNVDDDRCPAGCRRNGTPPGRQSREFTYR